MGRVWSIILAAEGVEVFYPEEGLEKVSRNVGRRQKSESKQLGQDILP
jgi:hypothetical protein